MFIRILFISKLNPEIDYIILAQKQREISRKWSIAIEQHNIYLS